MKLALNLVTIFTAVTVGFAMLSCGGNGSDGPTAPSPPPIPTVTSPPPAETAIALDTFGFAAIICDHDDPFDGETKTDYSDEVADFSNANMVCVPAEPTDLSERLSAIGGRFTPVLYLEPYLYDIDDVGGGLRPSAAANLDILLAEIDESGSDRNDIIYYLIDEPTLRNVRISDVEAGAALLRDRVSSPDILIVEGYREGFVPIVPVGITIWGFNAYTVPDPGAEPLYTGVLDAAAGELGEGQSLALIVDGIHTPFHTQAGLSPEDMADVARNYLALARARRDVSTLLVYTWAGGIDNLEERGVRDLPDVVRKAHEEVGRAILD